LLAALEEFGQASQATLGRRTGMDRNYVVEVVNELSNGGLVERARDPDDRRHNVVTTTPAGVRQLRRLDSILAEIQDELFAPLSADERAQLARLLARVLDHL
jgi:DNA-binding MarR family transcriptional regulator